MRRKNDRIAIGCAALCLLCTIVTVLVVAPTVLDASNRIDNINAERARNTLVACKETNARHDKSISALDELLKRRLKRLPPPDPKQLKESRESTVLLIDALVPKRDCEAVVKRQVKGRS